MEGWERIQYVIEREKMNKNSFSLAIGLTSNVTIGRIINEKRNPSKLTCEKIVARFPQYSLEWLLHGTGEMLNQKPVESQREITDGEEKGRISQNPWDVIQKLVDTVNKQQASITELVENNTKLANRILEITEISKEGGDSRRIAGGA